MKTLSVFLLFISLTFSAFSQNKEKIAKAFETGNVAELSQYIDENIDLTVESTEGIYSKAQAKVILQKFFSENSPGVFKIQHEGTSGSSKYVIGNLTVNGKSFRIYFLFKTTNSVTTIQRLRIEND